MHRILALFLVVLAGRSATAQQPLRVLTLPTFDSTYLWHFMERTGGGYVLNTAQPDNGVIGSTLITTDDQGVPLEALRGNDRFVRMVRCSDGGYAMLGTALVKTDAAFNIQWAKKLVAPLPSQTGFNLVERDGSIYVVSNVRVGDIDPSLSFYNTFAAVVHQFNGAGDLVAQQVLADTTFAITRNHYYLAGPAVGDDGSLYLSLKMITYNAAGTCSHVPGIIKLDSTLQVDWAYRYPMSSMNGVGGLTLLADGDLALYGSYSSGSSSCTQFKPFLQRIDPTGLIVFARGYMHADPAEHSGGAPLELADGTLIAPRTWVDPSVGNHVSYFDRLAPNGTLLGSGGFNMPWTHSLDGLLQLASTNGSDIAASRINRRDSLLFTLVDNTLLTACFDVPNTTVTNMVSVVRTAFTPAYLTHPFTYIDTTYAPFQSVPVTMLDGCDFSTSMTERAGNVPAIFPNPSTGVVNITAPSSITELIIFDAVGRMVHRSRPGSERATVEVHSSGLHAVRIWCGAEEHVMKVVIEGR